MINIEVLSNVKAQHHDNLEDIGKLCQLRKLGVVIDGKKSHLGSLLKAISDLHASLRSLSITIPTTTLEVTPSSPELQDIASRLKHHPEFLESLSISGAKHLFPLLTEGGNKKLAKVTLSNTPLNQDDLKFFAQLPMLQCVRLRHISCTESVLNFKKDDFKCLKYLLIEGSNLTNITFEDEAACELEKMVLSSTCIESISGVHGLPKFEELELNSSSCGRLLSSCFYNVERIAKLTLRGTLLKQGDLRIIARELNICCLVLLENSFDISQNQITFEKEEFIWLKLLSVDCSTITKINFITGSAPRLKKIVWSSFTSLSGINNLPRLKELEFNGYSVPNDVEEAIKNNKSINLKHNKP
ncbi:Os11g0579400 [Oryza sativa Japonica Group]|nr:Os11g0579400 [Oryza sativa Japonica Group]|eukprot:NP_001068146.1 Os11g0579400 [Oryza sativa Japonica Group]